MNRLVGCAAISIALLLAASCSHAGAGAGNAPADTAEAQRARWDAASIRNYSWSVVVRCMACGGWPGPSRIEVKDGKPVQLLGTDYKGNVEPLSISEDERGWVIPLTVEDLFDVLDEAYTRHAQTVDVTYDPQLGYPTEINIDPNYGCQSQLPNGGFCNVSDDETGYSVKSLEPS